jgi:hypothetical protein
MVSVCRMTSLLVMTPWIAMCRDDAPRVPTNPMLDAHETRVFGATAAAWRKSCAKPDAWGSSPVRRAGRTLARQRPGQQAPAFHPPETEGGGSQPFVCGQAPHFQRVPIWEHPSTRTTKKATSVSRSARKARPRKRQGSPECAKQCSCGERFTRDDLIHLRALTPIGMLHLDGDSAASTIYCFTHTRWACRTTFALPVETFRDEIGEKIPQACVAGTAACERHCSNIEDLELCEAECSLAPYRRFLMERLVPRK